MNKLLNLSLKKLMLYAGLVLAVSIPAYYLIIGKLWEHELKEHNIVLTTSAQREDSYLIILAVTLLTLLFFILMLGGFILVNRQISRQLWQPFYESLSRIKEFDLNKQEPVRFEKTNIAEFEELNESLNRLIAGNITVFRQQKEFADNASHELQTPLAIIQSTLDMLLQSAPLTIEQYNMIEEALTGLARVSRINKNLLLLTRIENSQFLEQEAIDISELLQVTLQQFTNFIGDKQLVLQKSIDAGVVVNGNRILLEILLNNLLINAIRHSDPASVIKVQLSKNNLFISNQGAWELLEERLFKRFGTTSSRTPGTGLGLALVKQVCDRYQWTVAYTFDQGFHVFAIHF